LSISTSTTNKIDRYDITEILLKMALKLHNPNPPYLLVHIYFNYVTLMVDNIREGRTANKGSGKKRCGRRAGNDGWWSRRRKLITNDILLIVHSCSGKNISVVQKMDSVLCSSAYACNRIITCIIS